MLIGDQESTFCQAHSHRMIYFRYDSSQQKKHEILLKLNQTLNHCIWRFRDFCLGHAPIQLKALYDMTLVIIDNFKDVKMKSLRKMPIQSFPRACRDSPIYNQIRR